MSVSSRIGIQRHELICEPSLSRVRAGPIALPDVTPALRNEWAMADEASALVYELVATKAGKRASELVLALEGHGFGWSPLGGKEGNFGLVNIGSDPALALVERLTNAIDAVIERAAREADPHVVAQCDSPREAVSALFGVADGRIAGLGDAGIEQLSHNVTVTLLDGCARDRPSIEIRDFGSGIAGSKMTSSILDLAGSNKLDKPYLAGAYGQGGSTTFAFTDGGTIIASSPDGRDGALTFVRYRPLDPRKNKNGRYEFLVDARGAIAAFDAAAAGFVRGTVVRHFDYELPRHHGALDAADGLASLAKATLFDPVLPIRFSDRRSHRRANRERLFTGTVRELGHGGSGVELRSSVNVPLGRRGVHGLVSVRYWLLAPDEGGAKLRPDDRHAVYVTNFGQSHDAWNRAFVVDDLRLPFLKASLVVQVELDELTPAAKRELLSSTRDRLKHGQLYTTLRSAVREALADEAALADANAERRKQLLAHQHAADHERLQRRFAEIIEAYRPGNFPAAGTNGKHAELSPASANGTGSGATAALPTLDAPTFVRFALRSEPLEIPHARNCNVMLESDAPDGYLVRHPGTRLVIAPDPPDALAFVRATDFLGGRARIVIRADAAIGTQGYVTARLTDERGAVHAAMAAFTVVAPPPPRLADTEGNKPVRVPQVFEIRQDQWTAHGFDERSVASVSESRDDISIFINIDNLHFAQLIDRTRYQQTGLTRARSTFVVQTALYAFLQHRAHDRLNLPIASEELEKYVREEYDRLAQTVVSSIAAVERVETAATSE